MADVLETRPRQFRAPVARGIERVEREGGMYKSGLIRQAAMITRGEALGHLMWVDDVMLTQVTDAINQTEPGVKSRFAHPSLSGDGLGKALGRMRNAKLNGDVVRADLHLYESAHDTPDGDLASYIMNLADEDPAAFGMSIVFDSDIGAEDKFMAEHEDKDGNFVSPDKDNTNNYIHARVAQLSAADVVDEPAANPDGLFHRGDSIAFEADAYLAYALGLSDEAPETAAFGVHPDRVRGFVQRFLDQRKLTLIRKDSLKWWRKQLK